MTKPAAYCVVYQHADQHVETKDFPGCAAGRRSAKASVEFFNFGSRKDNSPSSASLLEMIDGHWRGALAADKRGDFYCFYGKDARTVTRVLGLTLTTRNGAESCGVPAHRAADWFPVLRQAGLSLALCEEERK